MLDTYIYMIYIYIHVFRKGFAYVFTCVAYMLRIHFTYALHTFHTRKCVCFICVWCANHICFTCGLHMFCMRKTVGICIRTPRQAPIDGSLEAFWDSAIIS